MSKITHSLGNSIYAQVHPKVELLYQATGIFDHYPLILDMST